MEEGKLIMDIVLAGFGFILTTLFLFWFTGVNKTQKDHDEKIQKNVINQIINEKDNRIQDKELVENKKANQKAKGEFYKTAKDLAETMNELGNSQKENHILIKENHILIKQNMLRIENLEDSNKFIVEKLIKK
tara:strand:+ start:10687 stop:11085 length:399 start_codon:yes stop_codon:yes gene_type:complete